MQNIGYGHGPANRVRAARSMTGAPYLQQTGAALRAGTTPEALKYMDCSEFVSRVLAVDGITQGILPMNTAAVKALLGRRDQFAHSRENPKVGDIALREGHVGIVSEVGKNNAIKLVHAAGAGKVSLENKYAIKPSQYRSGTFYGYYRPLREDPTGAAYFPTAAAPAGPFLPKTQRASARNQPTKLRSDADGTFPLDEVIVRPSTSQTRLEALNDSINSAPYSPPAVNIPAPVAPPPSFLPGNAMSKTAFVLLFALSLSACNNQHETSSGQKTDVTQGPSQRRSPVETTNQPAVMSRVADDDTLTYSSDSLPYLALDSFELLTYRVAPDTLQLVSTSDFLYYPFGKFASVAALQEKLPTVMVKREPAGTDPSAKLYRGVIGNAFIKLYFDEEKKTLEVVSGNISTPKLKLANGIEVGMKKRAFFARFLKKASTAEQGPNRIVELISGLDGIRHYYTFKNNTLARIEFDTDYQFDKR